MHVLNVEPHEVFQALADRTRVRIARLLAESRSEACLCDLSEGLNEPEYKLSRHLKVLRHAGLLSAEKEGRWIYHRLVTRSKHIERLYDVLRSLPDTDGDFARDLNRYQTRIEKRLDGRCRAEPEGKPKQSVVKRIKRTPR